MSSGDKLSDEGSAPLFRPFTEKTLATIKANVEEQASRKAERYRLKDESTIGTDDVPENYSIRQHDEKLKPDPKLETGRHLPYNLAPKFPPELIATAIEDIDKFYENERTFVIINKKKNIFRFSATNSMFILSPLNLLRRTALYILVHPAFSFLIMATVLMNCVFMTMPNNETIELAESIFLLIYTVESCIKVIAMGFILGKFTYLRDPWNWLDFILNALAYVNMGIDLGKLSTLRTLRSLKALNTTISGLNITVRRLKEYAIILKDVMLLTLFSLSVFALVGVQLYMGILTQKCITNPDPNLTMSWDEYVLNYSKTEENWFKEDDDYILCGNSSGARYCPSDATCVQGVGPNPDYGYTTFDSFPWALLCAFRLMTHDYWESLYHMVLKTAGTWHICFFVVIIFWCSFYLVYAIFAVLATSYYELKWRAEDVSLDSDDSLSKKQLQRKAEKEGKAIAADAAQKATVDAAIAEPEVAPKQLVSLVSDDCSSRTQTIVTVVNMKEKDEEEKSLKEHCSVNCSKCVDIFCVWDCCICWVRFQKIVSLIIFDPFMELFITLCVAMNTLFMAMDHHNMEEGFYEFLHYGNYFFVAVYAIEAVLKLIAMSPKFYFREGWNKFDFIIVALSMLELVLEGVHGLSVLGVFRLLRVFKLAKAWPTFHLMLRMMGHTTPGLRNLICVFGIVIFIFSVMGMQLFGEKYDENKHLFQHGEIPYWNFRDFLHSYMIVFRALCGEWIETMWDCLLVGGWTCIPFFLSIVVIGNFLVLNLFIVLFLSCSSLTVCDTESTKKIREAIGRFSRVKQWLRNCLLQCLKCHRTKVAKEIAEETSKMRRQEFPKAFTEDIEITGLNMNNEKLIDGLRPNELDDSGRCLVSPSPDLQKKICEAVEGSSQVSIDELDSKKCANNFENIILDEYPEDCCPTCCYALFPFCNGDEKGFWFTWNTVRKKCFYIIEHEYYEKVSFTIILIGCLALAVQDVHFKDSSLHYIEKVFTVLFLFETLLKWLAYGLKRYSKIAWYRLEFLILLVFVFNQVVRLGGYANVPAFKTLCTLRGLLPLLLVARLRGPKVIVNTLVQIIHGCFSLLLVYLIFWLIFAIIGVQMMGGKFYSCVDLDQNRLNASFVPNAWDCLSNNYTWTNQKINFDNVLNAYLALFQVATVKGWIAIMNSAIDSTGVDQQPEAEYSVYMYLYFVHFIIFGVFFILSTFFGAFIHAFNWYKRKAEGGLEMFMTEDQKMYYREMIKVTSKKPTKAIPRPKFKLQALVFDLTKNKKFDMVIMIFLCLNMSVIALEHYDSTPLYDAILESLNTFFIGIFTVECGLKIFALRKNYFKKSWNVFDFIVVILSISGIVLNHLIAKSYFAFSNSLRVISAVGRVLRLVKFLLLSKGIQTLMSALIMSLPDLISICLLQFFVMFSYAIFGMFFFMNVRHRAGIDQKFNFETFGQSMILLFQISTSAGWDSVLFAIMDEDDCNAGEDGDCGSYIIAVVYLVSYLIISFFIILMYIATILYRYEKVAKKMSDGLTEDNYDMYYEKWQNFDPDGTQFIRYSALATFLDSLEEPLRIPNLNKYKIISMDIPIYEGDLVFCADVLEAIIKDFFDRKGHPIKEFDEREFMPRENEGCNSISSTLKRQREVYAARAIQSAWRRYKGELGDTDPRED